MIEIKEMYEVDDSFNVIGYYSEDHVNKEEFLEIVGNHIREDIEEGTIDWDWEDGDDILPKLEQVEYVWYKKTNLGEVDDYYEEEDEEFCFVFSSRPKEGYSRMTRVYL
jgi:hypothetical protein